MDKTYIGEHDNQDSRINSRTKIILKIIGVLSIIIGLIGLLTIQYSPAFLVANAFINLALKGVSNSLSWSWIIKIAASIIAKTVLIIGAVGLIITKNWGRKVMIYVCMFYIAFTMLIPITESVVQFIYPELEGMSPFTELFIIPTLLSIYPAFLVFYLRQRKVEDTCLIAQRKRQLSKVAVADMSQPYKAALPASKAAPRS